MTGLAVTVRTCQALLISGAVALTLATAQASGIPTPADPTPTPRATVAPSGAIAEPVTGRRKHHARATSAPPREPRLTMPPTDTVR